MLPKMKKGMKKQNIVLNGRIALWGERKIAGV